MTKKWLQRLRLGSEHETELLKDEESDRNCVAALQSDQQSSTFQMVAM